MDTHSMCEAPGLISSNVGKSKLKQCVIFGYSLLSHPHVPFCVSHLLLFSLSLPAK